MKANKLFTRLFFSLLIIMLLITFLAQMMMFVFAPTMVSTGDSISSAVIVEDYPDGSEENSVAEEIQYIDADNISQYIALVIKRTLPYSLLFSIAFSLLFSILISRKLSRPIIRMVNVTKDMALMRPDVMSTEHYCEEISLLSENINHMYAALCTNIDFLEKEKNKVIEAEKMKVDFLRAASHELKTPVTSVNIMLENMILKIGKYSDYEKYLPQCKSIVESLGDMINNILLTSKIGFATDDIKATDFDISELIRKQVEDCKVIAERKKITVALDLQKIELHTDQYLFEKALSGIIGNAVRYTNENGNVAIVLEKERLIISNECTPLTDEELSHIFEPFYRPDYARSKDLGGSGLGLYTTRLILEMLECSYQFVPDVEFNGMSFIINFDKQLL